MLNIRFKYHLSSISRPVSLLIMLAIVCPATCFSAIAPWTAADNFGYVATNQIPFNWIELNWIGTSENLGDDGSVQVNLPFPFTFYGNTYNSIYIHSNGYISFNNAPARFVNSYIPDNSPPNNIICPLWDDLTGGLLQMWHGVQGSMGNRRYVIEWKDVSFYSESGDLTFEVILFEGSNQIKFQYHTVPFTVRGTGGGATIGIEDAFGLNGVQYTINQAGMLENSYALMFYPPGSGIPTPVPTTPAPFPTPTMTPSTVPTNVPTPGQAVVTISQVNEHDFPNVELIVRVTNSSTGQPVLGLTQSDFTVREKPAFGPGVFVDQPITSFANMGATTGVSVGLVMDRSGSMSGGSMTNAKKAAINFINNMSCLDRMAVITFETNVQTLVPFTSDHNELEEQVKSVTSTGNTALYDAVIQAVNETQPEPGVKACIMFSDGEDTTSSADINTAITTAANSGIPFYTIGIGLSSGSYAESVLQRIAQRSGGTYTRAASASDLYQIYLTIAQSINDQYFINYDALDTTPNVFRTVRVVYSGAHGEKNYLSKQSCLIDKNVTNGVGALFITDSQPIGQQFFNQSNQALLLSSVDVYFEWAGNAVISLDIRNHNSSLDAPGSVKASADGNTRLIYCPGWQKFTFNNSSQAQATLNGNNSPYWIVIKHISGAPAYVKFSSPGTSPGAVCFGYQTGGPITWSPKDTYKDIYFRVFACLGVASPIPTPSPTVTPPASSTPTLTPTSTATFAPVPTSTPTMTPTVTMIPTGTPTLTPTGNPTSTPTIVPSSTPTPSPTQPDFPPSIMLAGYGSTSISAANGGILEMFAWVESQGENDLRNVELYAGGSATGLFLYDDATHGDLTAGDSLYSLVMPIGPGAPPGRFLIEMIAQDQGGNRSEMWPYYYFHPGSGPSPHREPVPYERLIAEVIEEGPHKLDGCIERAASVDRPIIYVGGYMGSSASELNGGMFNLVAVTLDPNGDLSEVELFYRLMPTGVMLKDDGASGDFAAGDGVFGLQIPLSPPLQPMQLLMEMVARDFQGNESMVWPYLEIEAATPTPSPSPTMTPTPTLIPTATVSPTTTPTSTPVPSACFEMTPDDGFQHSGEPVVVDATCSYSTFGPNIEFKWKWGDGTPETNYSTTPTNQHIYTVPRAAPYTIELTVRDRILGTTAYASKQVYIIP